MIPIQNDSNPTCHNHSFSFKYSTIEAMKSSLKTEIFNKNKQNNKILLYQKPLTMVILEPVLSQEWRFCTNPEQKTQRLQYHIFGFDIDTFFLDGIYNRTNLNMFRNHHLLLYKIKAGTWKTSNRLAVEAPVVPRFILATFNLDLSLAPTASHLACSLWQSTHSFV